MKNRGAAVSNSACLPKPRDTSWVGENCAAEEAKNHSSPAAGTPRHVRNAHGSRDSWGEQETIAATQGPFCFLYIPSPSMLALCSPDTQRHERVVATGQEVQHKSDSIGAMRVCKQARALRVMCA